MRIKFEEQGGVAYFPGLSRPFTLGDDDLSEEEAGELKRLADAARFFDLPSSVGSPARGAADYKQYTLTIDGEGESRTVRIVEPVTDADLAALLKFVRTKVYAARARERSPRE